MTYWHCALSVSIRSCLRCAAASKFQGAVVLSLRRFMNKALCWLHFFAPSGLSPPPPLPIHFSSNICLFYNSEQGEWQPATRVCQLPDFYSSGIPEADRKGKSGPESGQHYTGFALMVQNVSRVSSAMTRMKRPPSTPAAKTPHASIQVLSLYI